MAIDAPQQRDRFDLIDVQMPAMLGREVAAVMHRVVVCCCRRLTDAERESQKGA